MAVRSWCAGEKGAREVKARGRTWIMNSSLPLIAEPAENGSRDVVVVQQRRDAKSELGANRMARTERCVKCGFKFRFPNLTVRYVYQQCPLCMYNIPQATPLNIPPPHPEIPDRLAWPLCEARVCWQGVAKRCERKKVGDGEFCTKHNQAIARFGKLPYGKFCDAYTEEHKIQIIPERFDNFARRALDDLERQIGRAHV